MKALDVASMNDTNMNKQINVTDIYRKLNDIRLSVFEQQSDFYFDSKIKVRFELVEQNETVRGIMKFFNEITMGEYILPYIPACNFNKWVVIKKKGTLTLKVKVVHMQPKNIRTYKKAITRFTQG